MIDPLPRDLVETYCSMQKEGLNTGTSGNVSVRLQTGRRDSFLITPSGVSPEHCRPEQVAVVDSGGTSHGACRPSSEWRLHRDIYLARPEAGAVLHAHSPFATALACQRFEIPPFHYMIACFGGSTVRCAGYATFGTQALSDAVLRALEERDACLMANHGMVVIGRDLQHAVALGIELESLCAQYVRTRQIGPPALLSESEMLEVQRGFRDYRSAEKFPTSMPE